MSSPIAQRIFHLIAFLLGCVFICWTTSTAPQVALAAHIPGPKHEFGTNTSTFSPSLTFSSRTPTLFPTGSTTRTHSPSYTADTFSMTLTTVTPPLTPSISVSVSQMTLTFSSSVEPSDTITLSSTPTFTLSGASETISATENITETPEFTGSDSQTYSEGMTTTAMPETTSVPLSVTETLRSTCPDCKNGFCSVESKYLCVCYRDTVRGFWDGGEQGGTCNDCLTGYVGLQCRETCPGSACNPCNGHGACDGGVKGDGSCTCDRGSLTGFWDGAACDRCFGNYYGANCKKLCECSGNGACSAGRFGRGACDCNEGWSGQDCSVCDPQLIPNCITCPNLCSGHGRCGNAQSGNIGECACDQFWAAEDCSVGCPLQCSNAGNCSDGLFGTGNCSCNANHEPPGCDRCTPEFWGASCNLTCNCSGHGRCGRLDGFCACDEGFVGSSCEIVCERSSTGAVCGGHGKCTVDSGCACFRSSKTGYWTNLSCTDCLEGYGGLECKDVCPRSQGGQICASRGRCGYGNESGCACSGTFCGAACEGTLDGTGECSPCNVADMYGSTCDLKCACANGECDDGAFGTGECTCTFGWYSVACDRECPGGWQTPCSNRGTCDAFTGQCACHANFSTPDCSVLCPNCTHGKCDSGAAGTGECVCDENWVFPHTGCDKFCNCSGHGTCSQNLTCACDENWSGGNCSVCIEGRSGPQCEQRCIFGRTEGTSCVCDADVGGQECELRCPSFDGLTCGGVRGRCQEGYQQPGTCFCFSPHVGPSCGCNETTCSNLQQCNATSEACECKNNRGGATCEQCSRAFWGLDCSEACQCSGRGFCERVSGTCVCDSSDATGFWSGERCSVCADKYVGEFCQESSVEISQLQSLQSRYLLGGANQTLLTTNNFIVRDPQYNTMLAGGSHYQVAFNINSSKQGESSGHFTATPDEALCSAHINSWVIESHYYIFASTGTACNDAYRLFRSPTPAPTQWATASSAIASTNTMSIIGSTLYEDTSSSSSSGGTSPNEATIVLCYVPKYDSPSNINLHCQIATSHAPGNVYTIKLEGFRSVTKVAYSKYLRAIVVGGFGTSGCLVEFFHLNMNTLVITSVREFLVHLDQPQCVQIDCLREQGKLLILGLSIPQAVYIQVLSLQTAVARGTVVVLPSGQCSAVAVDEESDLGVMVFRRLTSTMVVKLLTSYRQEQDPANTGKPQLAVLGVKVIPNIVLSAVEIDPAQRTAFAVAKSSIGIVMLRFLLLDVLSVAPQFVDRRGGTRVTVQGRGFNDLHPDTLSCMFGTDVVPATYIANTTFECTAPVVTTFSCDAQPVEISLNGWGFTSHNKGVTRVEPPTIFSSSPDRIRSTDAVNVTVSGQGFVPTGTLLCKYSDNVATFTVPATFISSTEVVCTAFEDSSSSTSKRSFEIQTHHTNRILFANGTLDISLDSGIFTEKPTPFVIVGPLHHVDCEPPIATNFSATRTIFTTVISAIAKDVRNNRIGALDVPSNRVVRTWFQRSAETSNVSFSQAMVDGVSVFINPEFVLPLVSDIKFHVQVDGVFPADFLLRVVQGSLHSLNITQQPSSEVFSGERLASNPKLVLLDVSGNRWIPNEVTLVRPTVVAEGENRQDYPSETVSANGEVEFFNLPVDSRYGILIYLAFSVPSHPSVPRVLSIRISANCAELEFRYRDPETGELSCQECPEGAICSGTEVFTLKDGYWRQNSSVPIVYKCDREENCKGGATVGVCREGNTGPMCTLCVAEFGKDQAGTCTRCDDRHWVILKVIGTVLLSFVGVVAITILCIQYYEDDDHPLILPFILIDFGQSMTTLRFLDLNWAAFMEEMFSWAGMITDFELHSLASDCELRANGKTYLDKSIFYYSSLLFVPVLMLLVKFTLRLFPNIMLKKSLLTALDAGASFIGTTVGGVGGSGSKKQNAAAAAAAEKKKYFSNMPRQHKMIPVLCVCLQVYLFLSFQTTANHALNVFECRTIVRGATPERLLTQDLSVNCDSTEYEQAYGAAVFVSVVYGLAIPVASTVLTAALVSRFRGEKAELRKVYLSFQLLGFREGCWYWQTVILIRKFATLVVAIWNPYPLDAFLSLWIFYIYTLMVWKVRPYEKDIYNFIDILAFYCISSTINGGLLYRVSPWQALKISILVVIFSLYASLAGLVTYHSLGKLRRIIHDFLRTVLQLRIEREDDDGASDDAASGGVAISDIDLGDDDGDYFDADNINILGGGAGPAAAASPAGGGGAADDSGSGKRGNSPPNESSSVFIADSPARGSGGAATGEPSQPGGLLQQPLLQRSGAAEQQPAAAAANTNPLGQGGFPASGR